MTMMMNTIVGTISKSTPKMKAPVAMRSGGSIRTKDTSQAEPEIPGDDSEEISSDSEPEAGDDGEESISKLIEELRTRENEEDGD
jgi:hypothetical protein